MAGTIRFVDKNGNEIGRLTDFDNPDSITQLANKMDEAYFSGRVSDIRYLSNMVNLVRVGYSLTGPQ